MAKAREGRLICGRSVELEVMLLRFEVENFRCFRQAATLSMIGNSDDRHPDHFTRRKARATDRVLKAAVMYGANAHGKTKFVEAAYFLKRLVVTGRAVDQETSRIPFKLSKRSTREASKFIIEFSTAKADYEYGIHLLDHYIAQEWLFMRAKTKEVDVFKRVTTPKKDGKGFTTDVEFGPSLRRSRRTRSGMPYENFLHFVADGTRANQPFLKEAIDRNIPFLSDAFEWFRDCLQVITAEADYGGLFARAKEDIDFKTFMSDFICGADTGISRIEAEETEFNLDLLKGISDASRAELMEALDGGRELNFGDPEGQAFTVHKNDAGALVSTKVFAVHKMAGGGDVRFDIEDESAGTRRLLHLGPMLADLSLSGKTYLVDELDRKLHPLLAYNFIARFMRNSGSGQLIFTTHNTTLLNLELFRRDEIWFFQKDDKGAADLYSLADHRIRPDINIERGYLNGRFGAIPLIRELGMTFIPGGDQSGSNKPEEEAAPALG